MNTYLNTCLWFVDGYRFPMQHISFTWTGQHFFKQRRWKQQFCTSVLTGWQICAVTRYIGNLKATSCGQKLALLVSAAKYLFVNLISVNLLSVCPFCLSKWWTRSASQIRTRFSNILFKLRKLKNNTFKCTSPSIPPPLQISLFWSSSKQFSLQQIVKCYGWTKIDN